MDKACLGRYRVHTENSGWQLQVVQANNGFVSIEASVDGHCATSSANVKFSGKEPGKGYRQFN